MAKDNNTEKPEGYISPKAWYQAASAMHDFVHDAAQTAAIEELESLWQQLVEFKTKRNQFLGRSLLSPEVPKGLYMWGGVGRGKTFLMDAFYECLPYRRKRRIHFHNFMTEVHNEMKALAGKADPLIALADKIAEANRVLCLDEFHVEDIADAMILGRLLTALFERGVVLITTSNLPPDRLYENGLQRNNFLPVIDQLKRELKVLNVESAQDYRLRKMTREPFFLVTDTRLDETENEMVMSVIFDKVAAGSQHDETHVDISGRKIPVKKVAFNVVWFEFKEICGGAYAQSDYLEIARRFPTVFVSHIPQLTTDLAAEGKRFTWLIDVFYDNHVRLVASAAVPLEDVYADEVSFGDASRTASRLAEMQTQHYLQQLHHSQHVTLSGSS